MFWVDRGELALVAATGSSISMADILTGHLDCKLRSGRHHLYRMDKTAARLQQHDRVVLSRES
jgi:hypothetical protein